MPVRINASSLLLALCISTAAADWPQWRGPTANGVAGKADIPLKWGPQENVRWKTELPGPGSSTPVISGGKIFLTCYSGYGVDAAQPGDPAKLKRHALCFNQADGKPLWSHAMDAPLPEQAFEGRYITTHGYASSSAVTDGQHVYFFLAKSGVFAFTFAGKEIWRANVGTNFHEWGAGASPVLYKDLLIINAAAESDALVALNKRTGETVWSAKGMPRAWNTPVLVDAGGGKPELVVSTNGRLRAFDPDTGVELWRCAGIQAAELCPSIVAHQGVIYVLGHPGGQAMAVRAGGRGDVSQTHVLWRLNKGSNVTSPVFHNGHLYWCSDSRGFAYCVKADTGEIVYEERLQPNPRAIYASPVLVKDRLYYVSRTGGTLVLAARPGFELLAHSPPLDESVFNGSPAVVEGRVYLRSDRFLYCLGGR
jgi:outer membrane protein assembly factor BamB